MSNGSILHTVELPAFDQHTGQLSLTSHHLLSTPLSLLDSFPADLTLLLDRPPARPYQQEQQSPSDIAELLPRRKRRRLTPPSESSSPADFLLHRQKQDRQTTTDRETDEHHAGIVLVLGGAIDAVREGWLAEKREEEGWMGELGGRVQWTSREDEAGSELDLVGLAKRFPHPESPLGLLQLDTSTERLPLDTLFSRIVLNPSMATSTTLHLHEPEDYPTSTSPLAAVLLPPSSGFLLSDFSTWSLPTSGIAELGHEVGGWDVLVMDPPWPNASATRSSSYDTFDAYDLWKLDIPALLGNKPAIVAVWLTNKVKFRRLLLDKLFPAWNVVGGVEWYWVKIAEDGEPVWRLEATHRRCYEGLVVGYYLPPSSKVELPSLPQNKVFLSTPIGHSRKPVIVDLLRPFLLDPSRRPNVVELFARTTLSGFLPSSPSSSAVDGEAPEQAVPTRGTFLAVGNESVKCNVLHEGEDGRKGWIKSSRTGADAVVEC